MLTRKGARDLAASLISARGDDLVDCAQHHAIERARALAVEMSGRAAATIVRERAIACRVAASTLTAVQPGLFDARVLKQQSAAGVQHDIIRSESEARANMLELDANVQLANTPELALLLLRCSRD